MRIWCLQELWLAWRQGRPEDVAGYRGQKSLQLSQCLLQIGMYPTTPVMSSSSARVSSHQMLSNVGTDAAKQRESSRMRQKGWSRNLTAALTLKHFSKRGWHHMRCCTPYETQALRLRLLVLTGNQDFDSFIFASKEKPNIHSTWFEPWLSC